MRAKEQKENWLRWLAKMTEKDESDKTVNMPSNEPKKDRCWDEKRKKTQIKDDINIILSNVEKIWISCSRKRDRTRPAQCVRRRKQLKQM